MKGDIMLFNNLCFQAGSFLAGSDFSKYKLGVSALAAANNLDETAFINPLMTIVNLALRILIGILVGITGLKLVMTSIAMSTAVGDERQQKKDDLTKCIKNFIIAVAIAGAVLAGGGVLTKWLLGMFKDTKVTVQTLK